MKVGGPTCCRLGKYLAESRPGALKVMLFQSDRSRFLPQLLPESWRVYQPDDLLFKGVQVPIVDYHTPTGLSSGLRRWVDPLCCILMDAERRI